MDLLKVKVGDVMTNEVTCVTEMATMQEVNMLFEGQNIHHIPVTDSQGYIKGIISQSDLQLLKDWGTRLGLESSEKKNSFLLRTNTAGEIMNKNIVTISKDHTLEQCADIFRENIFHALPIVESGKIIGIITTYDLINLAYRNTPIT